MKISTYTCDMVGCSAQAGIMDQIEIPGTNGTFRRYVCKKHLKDVWKLFGCVVS